MCKSRDTQSFSLLPKVVNSLIAGIIGVSCVFPLDLVKTRLQNQQVGPNGKRMYNSMFDCFRKTFKSEGFLGMYRGFSISVCFAPIRAVQLASNDLFRHLLRIPESPRLPISRQIAAAGLTGMCQLITTTPLELLKIQIQEAGRLSAASGRLLKDKPSVLKIMRQLVKSHGFTGFYRGLKATALRDLTFSIIYFPLFSIFNDLAMGKTQCSAVLWCSFIAGCGSGSIAAISVTPLDVVKTRLQAFDFLRYNLKSERRKAYDGVLDCFVKIFKHEGIRTFFNGGACRMIVITPLSGITQTVYYLGVAEMLLDLRN